MQFDSLNSISPSFTGNSSNNNLADIAARVVEEFRNENGFEDDDDQDIYNFVTHDVNQNFEENDEEEDKEFEFAVVCRSNPNYSSHVSADEIVPKYPLFDRSLLLNNDVNDDVVSDKLKSDNNNNNTNNNNIISVSVRQPLGKLFREERETTPLSSEGGGDNLDGVIPGTYCIWKPKVESPEKCKKSNSTGNSSKRWRFRNLLQRSNSDGNMTAVKHAPVNDNGYFPATKKKGDKTAKVAGADDDGEVRPVTTESNCENKGGNRLRSYLRFKREQIGVSANVHR
ncbi:hypothetical protein M8C21_028077 [Ambrosia artemisiifolia]|uniref:Uncharacterized protein n=1 Tax=Ambrosia artemisiifolia TaxID=4212 RepID=A0AAD5C8N5_AMBAR|nr:hypothetical protein M8C21_028077 [Ambrosia artemisiifolia]